MSSPVWVPAGERLERANLKRFMHFVQENLDSRVTDYPALYEFSIRLPEKFWVAVWEFCGIRATGTWKDVLVDGDRMPERVGFAVCA